MRLLHLSDVLLGNLNFRKQVREANGGMDLLELDRRAAFDRAVRCAIHHHVEVLLVSGELLDGKAHLADFRPWLDERLQQLHAADVHPVIYDPRGLLHDLDAKLFDDDRLVEAADCTFAPLSMAAERAASHPEELLVAVGHGRIAGIGGKATFDRFIDDRQVAALPPGIAFVALGGMQCPQPITPNAWFSGSACGAVRFDTSECGALLVEIGRSTRRLLDVTYAEFDARRRVSITIDAGGMTADHLAAVLHERLDRVCWAVDEHAPLDADHPLAELYGAPCGANGVGWWSRPLLNVEVFGTPHALADVFQAHPLLEQMLATGEHLLAILEWCQRGAAKPDVRRYAPSRVLAVA